VNLKEFTLGMIGPGGESAIVAMIFGYFDESGTDLLHPHTAIGGFFGPIDDWLATMALWKEELRRVHVRPFHRVECKGRNGPYRGWTAEESAEHIQTLAEIAAASALHTTSASFNGDWSKVATTPELRLRYPHPYHMCFELLIENIISETEKYYGAGNQIVVVLEEQNQFSTRALQIYNIFKYNGRWPEICHFSYGDKANVPYLQLADLFVWEVRRYFWLTANNKKLDRHFPLIARLIGRDDYQEPDLGKHLGVDEALYSLARPADELLTFPPGMVWRQP
jgi:hypothetical protein